MNELEQSKELRDEARELLKQSSENLSKYLRVKDLALIQHRKLAYALSCLVQPFNTMTPLSDDEIEQLQKSLKNIPSFPFQLATEEPVFVGGRMVGFVDYAHERVEHRDVFDIVHAINVLAMTNTDVLHVFVNFLGHVNKLEVNANDATSKYQWGEADISVFRQSVYLHKEGALEKLLSIESQLTELIIEAREKAEAKAEVES
ncbi:hypothetical protein [Vibrio metschnikovii]|uniref:hypothetical protein n=1 Tax=Vibrio metschnikovii TaxID=28172 RepID=UPI001C3117F8|nr:hypothetical protein [Vibrio metschnikovii]